MTDSRSNFNSDERANQDFERIVSSDVFDSAEQNLDGIELEEDVIEHFYDQIKKISSLMEQSETIDQPLNRQLQAVGHIALQIIYRFHAQKSTLIKQYDFWLQPVAKEVLDGLISHAEKLKQQLAHRPLDAEEDIDWEEYIQSWEEICHHWRNRKALSDRILAVVSERVVHCIDKDLKMIEDYQNHQLASVNTGQNKRNDLQERLSQVTEEPLKQLIALRTQTHAHTSLQQAAEWVATFHEQRESYFDQLLMRIDTAVKDIVDINEKEETFSESAEDEGEIVFMERELESILLAIDLLPGTSETDLLFTECRLENLLDHLEQIDITHFSRSNHIRVNLIKEQIHQAFKQIKG